MKAHNPFFEFSLLHRKWRIFCLFCLSFPIALFAQGNFQYTTYTQENGLVSGTIRGLSKDREGFLWLMAENGLSRFDGYSFKKFEYNSSDSTSISSIDVRAMVSNTRGDLLFQTANGICLYRSAKNGFRRILSYANADNICCVLGGTNNFWIVRRSGIMVLDSLYHLSAEVEFPKNFRARASHLTTLSDNNVWISDGKRILCFNTALQRFVTVPCVYSASNKKSFESAIYYLLTRDGIPFFYSAVGLFKYDSARQAFIQFSQSQLVIDPENPVDGSFYTNNYLILSLRRNKLKVINTRSGAEKWIDLAANSKVLLSTQISGFSKISEKQVWVCTLSQGFFKVDLENSTVQQFCNDPEDRNSLPSNNISLILNDDNLVWLISQGVGLIKYEFLNPVFPTYRPTEETDKENITLENNIRTITELDKNTLLLGGLSGLKKFDISTKKFSEFYGPGQSEPLLRKRAISKVLKDRVGNLWIAVWGREGIVVISKDGKKMHSLLPNRDPKKPEYNSLRSMFIDSQNTLWVGTDNNIVYTANLNHVGFDSLKQISFEKVKAAKSSPDSLFFTICFAINETKDGMILLGTQNGFYTYDKSHRNFKRYVNKNGSKSSISANDVRAIFVDDENKIWIATNGGGMNYFDEKNQSFRRFMIGDGLPDNSVYSITQDNSDILWLGTNKGLCAFDKIKNSCRNFLLKDGIQNYEFNTNATYKTANGNIVFGGINGFNIFNPDSIKLNATPPKVVITEFKVLDEDVNFMDHEIKFKHNQNYISFEFAALNFFRNSENNYAYKLDGLDKDWIYCSDRRFTNYQNLAPGKYTFRVKASNSFGIWNENDASVTFSIATPWYNTWMFYALLLFMVSGLIYFIYRYRLQQAIELQTIRNNIARDLHDEIGSNLSSISLFTQVAKDNENGQESSLFPLLQKISEYTQTSQEAMNDIVWMVNTRNDRFENIIVRMRTLAVELLEAKNIRLTLNFDDALNQLKLGMNERKNFYLIYKEALNNIVKYAECTNVWIDLFLDNSRVKLIIKDDGRGFVEAHLEEGNGLVNMKKRAAVLKGEITIESNPGTGTRLELIFNL